MSKKKAITVEIICFLFIILFTYAAITKLIDYEKFRVQIGQSPLLTDFAVILAWLVPGSELVFASMLAIPRLRQVGLYASFAMMLMFTAYIAAILQFSENIPCSCGGVLENLGWTEHLVFNIGFVVLGLIGIFLNNREEEKKGKSLFSETRKRYKATESSTAA